MIMEESRVNQAANKILFITKREELLIAEDEKDKVIDTLFEEERHVFTQKIRSLLEEENLYLEEKTKHFAENLKSLLETKFQSFPDEISWVSKLETSSPSLKDINVKELKSKGVEVVYTKSGLQLKEPKQKDKSKRKAEDKEDAEPEPRDTDPKSKDSTADSTVPASDDNVNGETGSTKVLRKRKRT